MRTGPLYSSKERKRLHRIFLFFVRLSYKLTKKIQLITRKQPAKNPLPEIMAKHVLDLTTENENVILREWADKSQFNDNFLQQFIYNKEVLNIYTQMLQNVSTNFAGVTQPAISSKPTQDRLYLLTVVIEEVLAELKPGRETAN